ncbi:DUF1631 family protein [Aestuariirhabdus sp. Z084]|uniref:DUF1631 family protein n=1 Tax=Aestuariirhabdus haliotis TaxID=2918751 RepID=UPI00201B40E5|nr:DUF1631 family protein [Aestuariirhabdus haliotis]MCL6416790.1 DUF1631 family protein [Aestuariirhabdus haliotis]MCL6420790.1 DUF1631 family protein [Aestuariirhabdus haliotis]
MSVDQSRVDKLAAWLTKLDSGNGDLLLSEKVLSIFNQQKVTMAQQEEEALRLCAMFFESLNQWQELPAVVREPLKLLELPFMVLALKENLFAKDSLHPAMLFVRKLCCAGYGIDHEDTRSPIVVQLTHLCATLHDNDVTSAGEFEAMGAVIDQQLEKIEQRAEKIVQRMSDSEIGHALAQQAQRTLSETYNKIFSGKELPAELALAMEEHWCNSMRLICLQQGSASTDWTRGVRYAQFLTRIIGCRDDPQKKQALYNTVDLVINNSHDVFLSLHRDPEQLETLCTEISECLMGMLRGEPVELQPMFAMEIESSDEWVPDTLRQSHLQQVDELREGDWVNLFDEQGNARFCRLAVRINEGQQFIFVNRQGMRLKDMSRIELAIGIQQEVVKLLGGIERVEQHFDQQLEHLAQVAALHRKRMQEAKLRLEEEERERFEQEQRRRAQLMAKARTEAKARAVQKAEDEKRRAADRQRQIEEDKVREEDKRRQNTLNLARSLPTGSWLEQRSGEQRIKLKLAVISKADQQRVFVDRSGNKQLSLSEQELADQLHQGSLIVIESGDDFSSALATVVGGIRNEQQRRM